MAAELGEAGLLAASLATPPGNGSSLRGKWHGVAPGGSLAEIVEPDVVCGGNWMCVAPDAAGRADGAPIVNFPGEVAPCSCTPLWMSSGEGSALHSCTGWDPNGTDPQCCEWLMSYPWANDGDPNYGVLSFDSMYMSILAIFQTTTLEGWAYLMYAVQDAYNFSASSLFFVLVVVIGSNFVVNLFIAVICAPHWGSHPPSSRPPPSEPTLPLTPVWRACVAQTTPS